MSAKGSFSFRNDKVLESAIGDGVYIRLERVGLAVARIYFVNEGAAEVPIPDGFSVTDHTNGNIAVLPLAGREEFFLGWADNYSLALHGTMVLKLINQRQWALQGPPEREIRIIND